MKSDHASSSRHHRTETADRSSYPHGPASPEAIVLPDSDPAAGLMSLSFDGQPLRVVTFRGRPCVVAVEVGRALGYSREGRALSDGLHQWDDELIPDEDFETLRGDGLAEFKRVYGVDVRKTSSRAPVLTVLYETGLNLVCLKTERPMGKHLRRFLAAEVMPRLTRGQPINPGPSPEAAAMMAQVLAAMEAANQESAALRESNLALARSSQEISDRLRRVEGSLEKSATKDGVIGEVRAKESIKVPLLIMARKLSKLRNRKVTSIRMTFDKELRRAIGHNDVASAAWNQLPLSKEGDATRAIRNMERGVETEIECYSGRVVKSVQVDLPLSEETPKKAKRAKKTA
jgi:prophage antirepressor-like protein